MKIKLTGIWKFVSTYGGKGMRKHQALGFDTLISVWYKHLTNHFMHFVSRNNC